MATSYKAGALDETEILAEKQTPLEGMNQILKISNLNFHLEINEKNEIIASKNGCLPFNIAELSDGERNALIIIASVLTAPENTLILIDEPERHLHRSIISPLICKLLSSRADCAFIISTHDINLILDQKNASALLLREYSSSQQAWQTDYLKDIDIMDQEVSFAILGARKSLLFVEGEDSSLDLQLYAILYPNISVKAFKSCVDVEQVVKGIRASEDNHWVSAYGIIDRDDRTDTECLRLIESGIIPLEHYSVESLYYHPNVIKAVLNSKAKFQSIQEDIIFEQIKEAIVKAIEEKQNELSARLVERKIKDKVLRKCPTWKEISNKNNLEINFSASDLLENEINLISLLIQKKDIERLISRYPIKKTRVLSEVATKCLFQNFKQYEDFVRNMLINSEENITMIRNLIPKVTAILGYEPDSK